MCPPKIGLEVGMLVKSSATSSTNIVLCSHFHTASCSDTKACPTDLHFATRSHLLVHVPTKSENLEEDSLQSLSSIGSQSYIYIHTEYTLRRWIPSFMFHGIAGSACQQHVAQSPFVTDFSLGQAVSIIPFNFRIHMFFF